MDFSGPDLIGTHHGALTTCLAALTNPPLGTRPLTCQEGRFQFSKVQTYSQLSINSGIGLEHRDISRSFKFTE